MFVHPSVDRRTFLLSPLTPFGVLLDSQASSFPIFSSATERTPLGVINLELLGQLIFSGNSATADESAEPGDKPSPTLNAAPPGNAIILFDGSNLDAWSSQKNRQWETTDGPADWRVVDGGVLEVVPGAGSLITKRRFGDFNLHLEFRLLGEKTNGGVYLMTRYEINISDSYGKPDVGQCGAFSNLVERLNPSVAMAAPALQWQTFDIDFRAPRFDEQGKVTRKARCTVAHNGVTIHDDVELGDRTGAAKRQGDAPNGFIMLQEHGTAYQFRNIWIVDYTE